MTFDQANQIIEGLRAICGILILGFIATVVAICVAHDCEELLWAFGAVAVAAWVFTR